MVCALLVWWWCGVGVGVGAGAVSGDVVRGCGCAFAVVFFVAAIAAVEVGVVLFIGSVGGGGGGGGVVVVVVVFII